MNVSMPKSFLEKFTDDGLSWNKEEDIEDYASDSSSDDSSEEDDDGADDDEMEVEQEAPPPAGVDANEGAQDAVEQRVAAEEASTPSHQPSNRATIVKNLSAHPRSQELLFQVAQSEETPLSIDVDWNELASKIKTYPAAELGDDWGAVLLQGILRMNPPAFVVQKTVALYPKACIDMRAFYSACQFGYQRNDDVVELVMHHTMEARRKEGIQWGMLAFLGDARVRTRHARILLRATPTAVIDPDYGVHGVSPLDRMLSGALIHGDDMEWVEKLKLALLTAKFGSVDSAVARNDAGGRGWFPFHTLIRRLISKDFMGVKFGKFTFLRTLSACLRAGFSCQKACSRGDLPIHTALRREGKTNLGVAGERKLIKFLLNAHPSSATTPDGDGEIPLRLAIKNGWLCHDLLVDASPQALHTRDHNGNLAIHVALNGEYHSQFGTSGSRDIIKYLLHQYPRAASIPNGTGRLPLHLAVENGWPCHDLIGSAAPRSLVTRDVTNGLYPFQIAASSTRSDESIGFSILFELIRYRPGLLFDISSDATSKNGYANAKQESLTSFLESYVDEGLILDKEEVHEEESESSSSDDETSEDEGEDGNKNSTPPRAAAAREQEEADEETNQLPHLPINTSLIIENSRSHPRCQELLFRVLRSGETPIVRGDIDWNLLTSQIKTYPATELGDARGSMLLQSVLRMDPPSFVVQKAVAAFPNACMDMEAFYAACQFGSHHNDDVVEFVMHHTMEERRKEGIQWGMLAFLGDARVRTRHAKILLKASPTAVVDPSHGMFGVSPLDRMLSGALIHGDDIEWVEKLKLALLTAKYGSVDAAVARDDEGGVGWFPFHTLIRRLISKDFMGVRFGKFSFLRTLNACIRGGFSCKETDRRGDLPVHTALKRECSTNLGVNGERKLIKFVLKEHPGSAVTVSGEGELPLRLAILNGWPCYDLIIESSPEMLSTRDANGNLAIHIALSGKFHPRFGISGTRDIVKYLLGKNPNSASTPDGKGRLPLHLAMEHGWPCHDLIMAAAPRALETRDVTTRLYPFQIAACALQTGEEEDREKFLRELSILFELIDYGPLALTRGLGLDTDGASRKRKLPADAVDGK